MENKIELPFFYTGDSSDKWDRVEVHPVFDDGECCEVCDPGEETYWSVYVHQTKGGVICIADLETEQQANSFAELIETIVRKHKKRKP